MSWPIQICFVCNFFLESKSSIIWEFLFWISRPENRTWVSFWVDKTGSKSSLIWWIFWMICGMRKGVSLCTISPRCCIQCFISLWNVDLIKPVCWNINILLYNTYPVLAIVYTGSSMFALLKTSLLYSVNLFCKSESALIFGL